MKEFLGKLTGTRTSKKSQVHLSPENSPIVDMLTGKQQEEEKETNNPTISLEGGANMATVKELETLLAKVVKENGLEGAVIADSEGLPIASYLPSELDEDEIAASSAAILAISESKLKESGKGKFTQASIEAEYGYLIITLMKNEYVTSVLAPKDAKLGIILSAVRSIEKSI